MSTWRILAGALFLLFAPFMVSVGATDLVPGFPEHLKGSELEQEAYRHLLADKERATSAATDQKLKEEAKKAQTAANEANRAQQVAEEKKNALIAEAAEKLGIPSDGGTVSEADMEAILSSEDGEAIRAAISEVSAAGRAYEAALLAADAAEREFERYHQRYMEETAFVMTLSDQVDSINVRIDRLLDDAAAFAEVRDRLPADERERREMLLNLQLELLSRDYAVAVSGDVNSSDYASRKMFLGMTLDPAAREKMERINQSLNPGAPELTMGDPVLIALGAYYFDDVDTWFRYGLQTFCLYRKHASGSSSSGALGDGWFCSLDSCIAFGELGADEDTLIELDGLARNARSAADTLSAYQFEILSQQPEALMADILATASYAGALRELSEASVHSSAVSGSANRYASRDMLRAAEKLGPQYIIRKDVNGNGSLYVFSAGRGRYESAASAIGDTSFIERDGKTGGWILHEADGSVFGYNQWGKILFMQDRYASRIDFSYEPVTMRLESVSHGGRTMLAFEWNDASCISVVRNCTTGLETRYEYADGRLCTVTAENGGFTRFLYDGAGDVACIEKSDGTKLSVAYGLSSSPLGKRVLSVTNEEGFCETFSVSHDGTLVQYVDADGFSTDYHLSGGNLTQVVYPDGSTVLREYDSFGRVIRKRDMFCTVAYSYDALGNVCRASYDDGSSESWAYGGRYGQLVSYTDRDGIMTEYSYDADGSCMLVSCGGRTVASMEVNGWGGIVSVESGGVTERYEYDGLYNATRKGETVYRYDGRGKLVSSGDSSGNSWAYAAEDDGSASSMLTPTGAWVGIERDKRGNVVREIRKDIRGGPVTVDTYGYDGRHLLISHSSGTGDTEAHAMESLMEKERITYTPGGRLSSVVRWNYGAAAANDAPGVCERFSYNGMNELCAKEIFFVDHAGNRISDIESLSFDVSWKDGLKLVSVKRNSLPSGTFALDGRGNVVSKEDPALRKSVYRYSPGGKLISFTNVMGGTYTCAYDGAYDALTELYGGGTMLLRNQYDSHGRTVRSVWPDGYARSFTYSGSDSLHSVDMRDARSLARVTADLYGNITSLNVRDDRGNVLCSRKFSYDAKSRTFGFEEGEASGSVLLDAWGNLASTDDAAREFLYDADGFLLRLRSSDEDGNGYDVWFSYNAFGKLSSVRDSGGRECDICYDAAGRIVLVKDSGRVLWRGSYDKSGFLVSASGQLIPDLRFSYDGSGNVVSVSENGTPVASAAYSADMRIVRLRYASGTDIVQEYDEYGRIISEVRGDGASRSWRYNEASGSVTVSDGNGPSITRTYDRSSGMLSVSSSGTVLSSLELDALGSVTYAVSGSSESRFRYGKGHELLYAESGGVGITYEYDAKGRRKKMSFGGFSVSYEYDRLGRISAVSCNGARQTFGYAPSGQWTLRRDSDGSVTEREFYPDGTLSGIRTLSADGDVVFALGLLYDGNRRIAAEAWKDTSGAYVQTYGYDDCGRVVLFRSSDVDELSAQCRSYAGERGVPCSDPGTFPRAVYDGETASFLKAFSERNGCGQLLSLPCWTELYSYDRAGNRTQKICPSMTVQYQYDAEGRLTLSLIDGAVCDEYEYDADGNLVLEKTLYKTKNAVYNEFKKVRSVCLTDTRTREQIDVRYSYDAFGRMDCAQYADGTVRRFVYDGFSYEPLCVYSDAGGNDGAPAVRYRHVQDGTSAPWRSSGAVCIVRTDGSPSMILEPGKGASFCTTDSRGSLRALTGGGTALSARYTLDGEVLSSLPCDYPLFCGKMLDPASGLYDFGLRLYSPVFARFITEDPARDGWNWYAYAGGDPVNRTDSMGLRNVPADVLHTMSTYGTTGWTDGKGNSLDYAPFPNVASEWQKHVYGYTLGNASDEFVYYEGCLITAFSGTLNALKGTALSPLYVNALSRYFRWGDLDLAMISDDFGLDYRKLDRPEAPAAKSGTEDGEGKDGSTKTSTAPDIMAQIIDAYNEANVSYVLVAHVRYNPKSDTALHFVGVDGGVQIVDGKVCLKIVETSSQDSWEEGTKPSNRRDTWMRRDNVTYVPVEDVHDLRVFSNMKSR